MLHIALIARPAFVDMRLADALVFAAYYIDNTVVVLIVRESGARSGEDAS